MGIAEADARAQLLAIERDLVAIRFRLLGVHATLPAAPEEVVKHLEVAEDAAVVTHLRGVIEIVLRDQIEPAAEALRQVSKLREEMP